MGILIKIDICNRERCIDCCNFCIFISFGYFKLLSYR